MQTSAEISMYPLDPAYEEPILDFIRRLNDYPALQVETNTMSTQVFGEYEDLMTALAREIQHSFTTNPKVVIVLKIINADLTPN